jgi:hypothetical protein
MVVVGLEISSKAVLVILPYIKDTQYAYSCVRHLHQSRYNPRGVFRNPISLVKSLSCDERAA